MIGSHELCEEKPAVPGLFIGPDRARRQLSREVMAERTGFEPAVAIRGLVRSSVMEVSLGGDLRNAMIRRMA